MSIIADWEKIIVQKEGELAEKIRRRIRLNSEISQRQAEIQDLNEEIKNCDIIIKKILKEQWKEEDKIINKLRTSGAASEEKRKAKIKTNR